MENTLKQLLAELYRLDTLAAKQAEQIQQLQAAYTDLKSQMDSPDALPPAIR